MTQNLIRYAEFLEGARHNRTTERQTNVSLVETNRHNVATEGYQAAQVEVSRGILDESIRHNIAGEQENVRHNVATEYQSGLVLAETQRHNLAGEQVAHNAFLETVEHNNAQEEVAYGQLAVSQSSVGEAIRHNIAGETAVLGAQAETYRHNAATEEFSYANLAEIQRHNEAQEGIGFGQLRVSQTLANESQRHNLASEHVSMSGIAATYETNARTADIRERELDLRAKQVENDYTLGVLSSGTNSSNAYSNRLNAETRQGELDLSGYEFRANTTLKLGDLVRESIETVVGRGGFASLFK